MKRKISLVLVTFLIVAGVLGIGISFTNIDAKFNGISKEPRKFGATYMTMTNPYFVMLNETIQEAVEVNGDILLTRDPAQDQGKQNEEILQMLEEGVCAIFLQPVDWKDVKPALKACKKAGVPVFSVDSYVYDQEYVVSTIVSDNYDAGVQCAKDLMRRYDSAKIVLLEHKIMKSVLDRTQGFADTLQGHPGYEIVERYPAGAELETGMAAMRQILKQDNMEFDTVMGSNDPTALGALAALQQEGKAEGINIYGIDGSPDGKAMIKQGYMAGTSAQQPVKLANVAVKTAYQYLKGKPVDKEIIIPVTLITKDNLVDFDIDGWQ